MTRVVWDEGPRNYDHGVDRAIIFTSGIPVPWNGLVSVEEKISGGENSQIFLDGVKRRDLVAEDDFEFLAEAFIWPQELDEFLGVSDHIYDQNLRSTFGLTYRTLNGEGYKIHIIYNCKIAPIDDTHKTITDKADISNFKFDILTVPITIPDAKASAHLIIDTTLADPRVIAFLENEMYGSEHYNGYLPAIDQIEYWFAMYPGLTITDHGDGSWTADGPDYAMVIPGDGTFEITWPSAVHVDAESYKISTL